MFYFKTEVDQYYQSAGGLDPLVDEIEEWQPAFAGGVQAMVPLGRNTNVYGGWTRGFRQFAPRFGVTEHAWGVEVPNGFLEPVTGDQFELGVKHDSRWVTAEIVGYYTLYNNSQNVIPGTFQGQDWYDYNGNTVRDPGEDVYVNVGNGEAFLYGAEAFLNVNLAVLDPCFFGEAWSVFFGFTTNYGQDETNDIPLRHTQPMTGLLRLRWEPVQAPPRLWFELAGKFVDRFDRIPPDRLANDIGYLVEPQDPASGMIRSWGLPGYSVWDLRGGFTLNDHVELTFGLDNIFDKLYRAAHSRMDAPGRNFYASLNVVF
jgi:outer membrane receptor protein involved in Fe transport